MKKSFLLAGGLLCGAAVIYLAWRSLSGPDPAYYVKRADYLKVVAASEAQHKTDLALIAAANMVIAGQDKMIADLTAAAGRPTPAEKEKDKTIAALEEKIGNLEAQGDLAGALQAAKAEIKAWAEKFSLAATSHRDTISALNRAWQVKFDAQVSISDAWRTAYEREHGLRLTCDSLRASLECEYRSNRIDRNADLLEEAGISAYSAIAHGDFVPLGICIAKEVGVKAIDLIGRIF